MKTESVNVFKTKQELEIPQPNEPHPHIAKVLKTL